MFSVLLKISISFACSQIILFIMLFKSFLRCFNILNIIIIGPFGFFHYF